MAFELAQLAAFHAVVEHGSLGRAAQSLHITQPALSRTVRRLEAQVGAPLFERYTTGMVLTAVGEALKPHAELLLREAAQAREEIDAVRGITRGRLRLGAVAGALSGLVPRALDALLARRPQLRVELIEGVGDMLADALLKRRIDLAIGVALPTDEELRVLDAPSWDDTSTVIAAAGHPLHAQRRPRLADLLRERWALPPRGSVPVDELGELFAAHGLQPPVAAVESRSIVALRSLVLHAGFLSWMAAPMFEAERRAGLIVPLPVAGAVVPRRLRVFCRRRGMLPGPAAELLEVLRTLPADAPPATA